MSRVAPIVLVLALLAGCGVETVQIERQPASAFTEDPAEAAAYGDAEERCASGRSLRELADRAGADRPRPEAIARGFAEREPDANIASAAYSGCLDGIGARN